MKRGREEAVRAQAVEEVAAWLARNAMLVITQSSTPVIAHGTQSALIANAVRAHFRRKTK